MLVRNKADITIISPNVTWSRHDIAEKKGNLALNNNYLHSPKNNASGNAKDYMTFSLLSFLLEKFANVQEG